MCIYHLRNPPLRLGERQRNRQTKAVPAGRGGKRAVWTGHLSSLYRPRLTFRQKNVNRRLFSVRRQHRCLHAGSSLPINQKTESGRQCISVYACKYADTLCRLAQIIFCMALKPSHARQNITTYLLIFNAGDPLRETKNIFLLR